jgi:hypothetical protein
MSGPPPFVPIAGSKPELDSVQPILAQQFNPASLTGTFQPVTLAGFSDTVKIWKVYNGGSVAIDISLDGTNLWDVWPAGATLIIDLQTNHNCNPPYGSGTLNGRLGQVIWVRTCVNPTWLTITGLR